MYDILGGFLVERIFALYDSDFYYATRFMEYFKKRREIPFEIIIFTHLESLKEFLQTNFVNVLLLGSDLDEDEIFTNKVKYIYQFNDDQKSRENMDRCFIHKHQPVQQVMQDILSDFRSRESRIHPESSKDGVNILTVFLPRQRQEAHVFTMALYALLLKYKNVLFINLELLPVTLVKELESNRDVLSEIIYYIKENKDINTKLKELSNQTLITNLGGADHASDILALDSEDIKKLIGDLRRNTDYQIILFYINSISEALMELIIHSDSLITIKGCTEYDKALYETWLKQLQRCGKQISQEQNFFVELLDEDYGQAPIPQDQLINSKAWQAAESCLETIGL
jgi:Icc-related predicted phosphoesterase